MGVANSSHSIARSLGLSEIESKNARTVVARSVSVAALRVRITRSITLSASSSL